MTDHVWEFVDSIKEQINRFAGNETTEGMLDEFSLSWDAPSQTWTYELSFNQGDDRTLKIKIDVNPDE